MARLPGIPFRVPKRAVTHNWRQKRHGERSRWMPSYVRERMSGGTVDILNATFSWVYAGKCGSEPGHLPCACHDGAIISMSRSLASNVSSNNALMGQLR